MGIDKVESGCQHVDLCLIVERKSPSENAPCSDAKDMCLMCEDLTSFSAGKSGSPMTSFEYRAVQAAGKSS